MTIKPKEVKVNFGFPITFFGGFDMQVRRLDAEEKLKKKEIIHYGDSRDADIRLSAEHRLIDVDFETKKFTDHTNKDLKNHYFFPLNDASAYRIVEKNGKMHI